MAELPRPVTLFGLVSLFNDFASEMIYPLLPAFVVGVLGGGAVALGTIDGAADFASAFVKYGAGRLAERERRRAPLIVWGYLVAVLVRPLIALAGAAWQVVGLRVADRVGKGVRGPPRDAVIADVTPDELLGRAFGLQRGLDHAGAVLGPLAAWWLLSRGTLGVRGVIAASVVPGVAVVALAVWAVGSVEGGKRRSSGEGRRTATGDRRPASIPSPSAVSRPLPFPPALLAIAAFYLLRMPETLIILHTQRLGVSVASVLVLWAALHVVRSTTSFIGGSLSDRIGPARTMWVGWVWYAAIAFGFARARGAPAAWALFLLLGTVAGLTESPERALVSRLARGHQGTGFGVYYAGTGIAALTGGVALGAVTARWGAAAAFTASAGAGLATALLWPVLMRRATMSLP